MSPYRLLVIDDEADVREICQRGLRQAGYAVAGASSGREALAMARRESFDLLLVDSKMPGMDGLQTFRAVRALQPDVVGVIVTGYATVDNAVAAVNQGFSGFVLKPFKLQQLQAAVHEALTKRKHERERARLAALTSLSRLNAALPSMDLDAVLQNVAQVALEETRSEAATVVLLDGQKGEPYYVSCGRPVNCQPDLLQDLLKVAEGTDLALVPRASEMAHPGVNEALQSADLGCLAVARLALPGRTLGLLCIGREQGAPLFVTGELEALKVLSAQAAIVISNVQLLRQVVEEERLRQALQRYLSPRTVQAVINGYASPGAVGEAGWMTVLLADVRDFSGLVERAEYASIIEVLHEYFSTTVEIISAHQGMVDELSGDEILASFDRAGGQEDDALRAVKAGLQMLERLDALRADWREHGQPSFDIGIGISSGLVAIGSIGSGERRALVTAGRILNLAARSQALTRELDLRLIITQGTFDQVREQIRYRELGMVRLKGITEPVGLYGVYGLKA